MSALAILFPMALATCSLWACWRVWTLLAPGDAPRLAWGMLGFAITLALISMLQAFVGEDRTMLVAATRIGANVLWAASMLGLARVMARSGLSAPWSVAWVFVTTVVSATSAVFLFGALAADAGAYASGQVSWWWTARTMAGVAADFVVFNTTIQVVRMVWPMRHGAVAWPHLAMAGAALSFLVTALLGRAVGAPFAAAVMENVAWALCAAAPLLQVRVLRRTLRFAVEMSANEEPTLRIRAA